MRTLNDHPSTKAIKLLNVGDSKSGKSGALASLARAGYNLWILDYDNGLDILANVLRDEPEALARIHYETIRDTIATINGVPQIKPPITAFKRAGQVLKEWGAENFTPRDIIVLDTLTTFSQAGFNEATFLGGRLNQKPQLQDYGWMADRVMLFLQMLTDDDMKCNVIVNTHVRYFAADEESQVQARGLPNAKGQEISRSVSILFNTVLLTTTQGSGPATRRIISTKPQGVISVATSSPSTVKPSYSIETGMAELFRDVLGHGPNEPTQPAKEIKT